MYGVWHVLCAVGSGKPEDSTYLKHLSTTLKQVHVAYDRTLLISI